MAVEKLWMYAYIRMLHGTRIILGFLTLVYLPLNGTLQKIVVT